MFDLFKRVKIFDTTGVFVKEIGIVNMEPQASFVSYNYRIYELDQDLGGYKETISRFATGHDLADPNDSYDPWGY